MSQPAFLYLVWLDGQGGIHSMYPWRDRAFRQLPELLSRQAEVHSPTELNLGWPVEGPSGVETLVLLAHREPLPKTFDLAALLGAGPKLSLWNSAGLIDVGFQAGKPVVAVSSAIGLRSPGGKSDRSMTRCST